MVSCETSRFVFDLIGITMIPVLLVFLVWIVMEMETQKQ